jgi:hypothetical protein
MSKNDLSLVSFKPHEEHFIAFLPMEQFLSKDRDPEPALKKAAQLYEYSIIEMRSVVAEINSFRNKRTSIPAKEIWEFGDLIFGLTRGLERLSFQLDGIYDHLVRDLGAKRKWLEKVIIFRRYIPDKYIIPESLNWGRFEKGTRRKAEKLRNGMTLD